MAYGGVTMTDYTSRGGLPYSVIDIIRDLVSNGMTRREAMDQLNESHPDLHLTYGQVYHVTRDMAGVITNDITKNKAFIGDRPRREVVMELYDQGIKPREIERRLGIHYVSVVTDIQYMKNKRRVAEAQKRMVERLPESPALKGPDY